MTSPQFGGLRAFAGLRPRTRRVNFLLNFLVLATENSPPVC